MFITSKEVLTLDDIKQYLEKFNTQREQRLFKAYEGKTGVGINNAYPKYIVDMLNGYFLGIPVSYQSDNKNLLKKIIPILEYNDEAYHNAELGKTMGICGTSIEYLYQDEDGRTRFIEMSPLDCFAICDSTLKRNIKAFVRQYRLEDKLFVEVSDSEAVTEYSGKDIKNLSETSKKPHYFNDVPAVVYYNNKEKQGDFEQVLDLIEAYNEVQANTLQDMKDFTDAFLVLVNMLSTDEEDIKKAKRDKTLLLDGDGKADWLIKNVNDNWVENFKQRLKHDIHKFSQTPDLTDENFGSNLSGVSIQYKILAMEQLRKIKERNFKKGLQRRLELICNVLKITNDIDGYTDIKIKFNTNLPKNVVEQVQIINGLSSYLPMETLLNQLPFVEDVTKELELKEKELKVDDYGEEER